jgi:hypothetical protein
MKKYIAVALMLSACGKKDAPTPTQYVTRVEMSDYTATAVIDPCGLYPGKINEVLLVLANGHILASFSDNASGLNTRFGLLTPGNYVTSDGTLCYFTIDADYKVINDHY